MNNQTDNTPEGFKMTELGLLPEEWGMVRAQDRLVLNDSGVWGQDLAEGERGVEVLRSTNMQGGAWVFEDVARRHLTDEQVRRYCLQQGDILITKSSGSKKHIGKAAYVDSTTADRKCAFSNFMQRLRFSSDVCSVFAFFVIVSESGKDALLGRSTTTTGLRNLRKGDFAAILLPLPPLPQQKAIAGVLSTIEKAIEAQGRVIAATRELKKSLMRHLFTYGPVPVADAEKVPLKETEIGPVPQHWEVIRLGERCDVKGGKRLPKGHAFADEPTKHPYIRVVDLRNGSVDLSDLKFLTHDDFQMISRYTITASDVYISIAGTTGLVGTIPERLDGANLTENAAKLVIRDTNQVDRDFLKYSLSADNRQQQILQLTTKTSQPKLALSRIQQIVVPLPPISEQQQVARILSTVAIKTEVEEKRKASLQSLFRTMLDQLMTGKLRVKDLEVITA